MLPRCQDVGGFRWRDHTRVKDVRIESNWTRAYSALCATIDGFRKLPWFVRCQAATNVERMQPWNFGFCDSWGDAVMSRGGVMRGVAEPGTRAAVWVCRLCSRNEQEVNAALLALERRTIGIVRPLGKRRLGARARADTAPANRAGSKTVQARRGNEKPSKLRR